jgi:hypothetical protein
MCSLLKRTLKYYPHFTNLIVVVILFSCDQQSKSMSQIQVDSVLMADTIHITDPLIIEFYGIIHYDGCCQFDHFTYDTLFNEIIIKAYKKCDTGKELNCPAVIVEFDNETLEVDNLNPGLHYVKIDQPDNSFLLDSVFVKR